MLNEVSHSDLQQDIGGLKVGLATAQSDITEIKVNVKDGFSTIEEKLQTLLDERQQRIGIRKFVVGLYAAVGALVTLAAQWALKKLGG